MAEGKEEVDADQQRSYWSRRRNQGSTIHFEGQHDHDSAMLKGIYLGGAMNSVVSGVESTSARHGAQHKYFLLLWLKNK